MGRTDVVSTNLLKNIKRVKEIRETEGTASTLNSVWVTLVSIAAPGWLYVLHAELLSGTIRLTIDGKTPQTFAYSAVLPRQVYSSPGTFVALPLTNVRFDSTILVEYTTTATTSTAATARIIWGVR